MHLCVANVLTLPALTGTMWADPCGTQRTGAERRVTRTDLLLSETAAISEHNFYDAPRGWLSRAFDSCDP